MEMEVYLNHVRPRGMIIASMEERIKQEGIDIDNYKVEKRGPQVERTKPFEQTAKILTKLGFEFSHNTSFYAEDLDKTYFMGWFVFEDNKTGIKMLSNETMQGLEVFKDGQRIEKITGHVLETIAKYIS